LQAHTTAASAERALDFEAWLLGEYKDGYSGINLTPFTLHSLLSDSNDYLASEYISSFDDDHPNTATGKVVGDKMVKHLAKYIK